MALWGNNDNVSSIGTISLDYGTRVVTGTGTSFGTSGHPQEGDVIRFGTRGGTYFGDGVIVSIASTISCTIGSTMGLDGSAISGVQYTVSECPSYTVSDESYSQTKAADPSIVTLGFTKAATGVAAANTTIVPVDATSSSTPAEDLVVGDALVNGGSNKFITAIGSGTITIGSTITSGISTGDTLTFKRFMDGYDKLAYGTATADHTGTAYDLTHGGWVGVTTYKDCHGNLRVKKETLVAMSGITTGGIVYPTNV